MAKQQVVAILEDLKTKLYNAGESSNAILHPYDVLGDVLKLIVLINKQDSEEHGRKRENDAPETRPKAPKTPPKEEGPELTEPKERSAARQATGLGQAGSEKEAPGLEESKWSIVGRKKPKTKAPTIDLTRGTPTYSQVAAKPGPTQIQQRPQAKVARPQQQAPKRETPAFKLVLSRESDLWPRLQLSEVQLRQEVQAKMGTEVASAILGIRIHRGGIVVISPKPGQGHKLQQ